MGLAEPLCWTVTANSSYVLYIQLASVTEKMGGAAAATAHAPDHVEGAPHAIWQPARPVPAEGADLAGSLLGIGSGWQQSKQDWGLPAVMGKHV